MVLPASAADLGAAQAQDRLAKLIRQLERSRQGVLFALTEVTPTQLGSVVRALSKVSPWEDEGEGVLEVCLRAQELLALPVGSRVLLRVRVEDLEWLNLYRPLFADRELRAILWVDAPALAGLVRHAVDLFDWVSRVVPLPGKALPDFAVDGVRTALAVGDPVAWTGGSLREALSAAGCEQVLEVDARLVFWELVEALGKPGLPVVSGLRTERDAWRVRMALARAGRAGSWVALEPAVALAGMWPLHARQADWDAAVDSLREAGCKRPGLLAAWLELEPEMVEFAAAHPGVAPDDWEWDPGAVASASAPAWALRRYVEHDAVAVARGLLVSDEEVPEDEAMQVLWSRKAGAWDEQQTGAGAPRLVRALRELEQRLPSVELVHAAKAEGFDDVAAALERVRWERGADQRADALVKWLSNHGHTALALEISTAWHERATAGEDERSLAAAKLALGELHVAFGDSDRALALVESNFLILKKLVEREPDRSDLQRSLSVSYERLGDLHRALGNGEVAQCYYEDCLAIREQLVEREPGRSELQRSLSVSYNKLGDLHRALGNVEVAQRYHEDSLAIREQLVEREPGRSDLQRDLSVSYERLGALHGTLGNAEVAQRYYEDSLAIGEQLVEREPGRSDLQRYLCVSYDNLGELHRALGNAEVALRYYEDSLAIRKQLVEREPGRSDLQRDLRVSYNKLGELHRALGNAEVALRYSEDDLAIARQLAEREPGRSDLQRDLSVSYNKLGDLHGALGNAEVAQRYYDDGLAIIRQLVEREPGRSDLQRDLSVSYERLGALHGTLGNAEVAQRYYEDSLAIARQLVEREPGRSDLQRDLATSFERMAQVEPERAADWLRRSLEIRRSTCARDPASAVARRELGGALVQLATVTNDKEALREGYSLLNELRSRGALDSRYHPIVDQLAEMLEDHAG